MRTALAATGVSLVVAGSAFAQSADSPGRPQLVLSPPASVTLPDSLPAIENTDPARDVFCQIFARLMDTDGDGVLSRAELRPWVAEVRAAGPAEGLAGTWTAWPGPVPFSGTWTPVPGTVAVHEGTLQVRHGVAWTPLQGTFEVSQGTIEILQGTRWTPVAGTVHVQEGTLHVLGGGTWTPVEGQVRVLEGGTWTPLQDTVGVEDHVLVRVPPECSEDLTRIEQSPQASGVVCGSSAGNLVFRTVCNASGCASQAISLPDGRDVACFGIEAQTSQTAVFTIYPEGDPGRVLYDSRRDGPDPIGGLHLAASGVYRIALDEAESAPGARVTVRFVDHPE